jgi:hypothetical protein
VISDASARRRIVTHLEQHWFDQASPEAYFPGVPVASIYAPGILKALELALAGRRLVVPLNAWWLIGFPEMKLLSLADVDSTTSATIGGRVTLLILTPRPQGDSPPTGTPIWGDIAQAFVTEQTDHVVTTVSTRSH